MGGSDEVDAAICAKLSVINRVGAQHAAPVKKKRRMKKAA